MTLIIILVLAGTSLGTYTLMAAKNKAEEAYGI